MTANSKPTHNKANNVYTGGIKPKPKHEQFGVYSERDLESAKNIIYSLAIGGAGLLIAFVLELIK